MTWGVPGSGPRRDRQSRRPLNEAEADDIMRSARMLYEGLSDAQLARIKSGEHKGIVISRDIALGIISAVEGAYVSEGDA